MRSPESHIKNHPPAIAGVQKYSPLDSANNGHLNCVELFAGCGALAMGLKNAGFHHLALAEFNAAACETLRINYQDVHATRAPLVLEADVRTIDWRAYRGVDLVAGGPPCQPFSNGGRAAGPNDVRDMWPEAIRAVREMQPRAFLFENVKGLLRPAFSEYLSHILRCLEQGGHEHACGSPTYRVTVTKVNAADYGSPQKRERVLIVGVRDDCRSLPDFPAQTHSEFGLAFDKWVTGEYWKRHNLPRPDDTASLRNARAKLAKRLPVTSTLEEASWLTCRDAFAGLGAPSLDATVSGHEPRGASKQYEGHTGSLFDEPAKTLKAGTHGVPGGENMVVDLDGTSRRFTVREAARLQGLPDTFKLPGSWSQSMRQLGNAVPVELATVAGCWIASALR